MVSGSSFLANAASLTTTGNVMFDTGTKQGMLSIAIELDDLAEVNDTIEVVLVEEQTEPGTTYSVDPANDSGTVAVSDDDSNVPVLSIAGPANAITEGVDKNGDDNVAEFVITSKASSASDAAALNPDNPIIILYNVTDASGDFLDVADEGDQSTGTAVNFTDDGNGNYIYTISIPIGDDKVIQPNGDITVTLRADDLSPATYTLGYEIQIIRVLLQLSIIMIPIQRHLQLLHTLLLKELH